MGNLESFEVDWNQVEVNDFKPLPAGIYAAKVIQSEIGPTKKGDQMMKLTFEVLGVNKGRRIFENYMLTHSNPKAVQAGLGKIKSLASSVDVDFDNLSDTSEFHGKPMGIKVKIEESEEFGDKNRIMSFLEYEECQLEGPSSPEVSNVKVDEVQIDEPDMVEDDEVESKPSPQFIRGLKKADFLLFVKNQGIDLVLTGKKLSELKDEVVEKLFGTEIVSGDGGIIIED